jgi:hypothetical protein
MGLNRVVLPAPFWPNMPSVSPCIHLERKAAGHLRRAKTLERLLDGKRRAHCAGADIVANAVADKEHPAPPRAGRCTAHNEALSADRLHSASGWDVRRRLVVHQHQIEFVLLAFHHCPPTNGVLATS